MEPLRFPAAFLSQLGPFISSTILLCCGTRYLVLTAPRTNAVLPSLDCALLKASLVLVYWWNRNKPTPCQCASVPAGRLHLSSHAQPPPNTRPPQQPARQFSAALRLLQQFMRALSWVYRHTGRSAALPQLSHLHPLVPMWFWCRQYHRRGPPGSA